MMFLIYVFSIVDNMRTASLIGSILSFIFLVVSYLLSLIADPECEDELRAQKNCLKVCKIWTLIFIPTFLIAVFLPNSKTIAAMYLVPKIVENQKIQDITGKAGTLLEKKLDQWIEDFSKDADKK